MKPLSSLLVGLGLVGAGLAAPVLVPHAVPTDYAAPLTGPGAGRADASLIDAVVNPPSAAASLPEQLSHYVPAAVKHLPLFDISLSVTPVFAVDTDDAEVVTDVDGDLVMVGSGQRVRAIIWNPSSRTIYLDPTAGVSARLPVAILLVSLWLLFTCLYLGRSADSDKAVPEYEEDEWASASEQRRLRSPRYVATRAHPVEKPALDGEHGVAGQL